MVEIFPDGSHSEEFGTTQTQDARMAVAGSGDRIGNEPPAQALPNAPMGLSGTTSADVAETLGNLTPLASSPAQRDSSQDQARRALLASAVAADPTATAALHAATAKVMTACPKCGHKQAYTHDGQTCSQCGTKLKKDMPLSDETPFSGNSLSQAVQEFALNLGGDEQEAAEEAAILHLSAEQLGSLDLAPKQNQRMQWAKENKALPDGSWPIPNIAYLKKAIQAFPGRAKGQEGRIKKWIMKRANALGYKGDDLKRVSGYGSPSGVNASQPGLEMWTQATGIETSNDVAHMVEVGALSLDHTQGDKGLIWKVLCKTGTLALSPGPGQVDVEKPLNLTAEMFKAVKQAYDEKAFEHVTIPETHGNGTLENTGTVQALDILNKQQALGDVRLSQSAKASFAQDPDDTLYMLGGMHFTDPKVREKAANGSILNCSVGLKFNYRRKRDGKLFPVALEHTALTNQPWVDGLGAFGGADLSAPIFDQDALPVWDGVFVTPPESKDAPTSSASSLSASEPAGGMPSTMSDTATPSLEQILASQAATIERLEREARERDEQLQLSQGTIAQQGRDLHIRRVNERVSELQGMGVPPAVLVRYQNLAIAAYDAQQNGESTLQLSVKEGESTVTKEFGPVEQAEYLLAAMPLGEASDNVVAITRGIAAESLALSQQTGERVEPSTAEKADAIERRLHPERFDGEGKRISQERAPGAQAS